MSDDLRLSKFLSLVLRHKPEELGLVLDSAGWVPVPDLLAGLARQGWTTSEGDLERIVRQDTKGRYTLEHGRIRANQGHSVPVPDLELVARTPPDVLYHGTGQSAWDQIQTSGGLRSMARHHVHLSEQPDTARVVGSRRRSPLVLLQVDAARMAAEGHEFFVSSNGVWLTGEVPIRYLKPLS